MLSKVLLLIAFSAFHSEALGADCPDGWSLIKKFDFSSDDAIRKEWDLTVWPAGQENVQKQSYTNDSRNVFSRDGHLVLKAFELKAFVEKYSIFTSGQIQSKDTYTAINAPGKKLRVEFTGKVPTVPGAWPAYFVLGIDKTYGDWPTQGEMDVMEWVQQISGTYKSCLRWSGPGQPETTCRDFNISADEMKDNYTTYGVEWSAVENNEYVQFYFRRGDGLTVNADKFDRNTWSNFYCGTRKLGGFPCSYLAPFDNYMNVIINLAVGGDWGGIGVSNVNYDVFQEGVEFETSDVTVCQKQ